MESLQAQGMLPTHLLRSSTMLHDSPLKLHSYGGYMMNWIQGHDLGRKFQALVTHDGSTSTLNQYTTEELWFMQHDVRKSRPPFILLLPPSLSHYPSIFPISAIAHL